MLKHGFFLLLTLLSCNAFSQDVIYMNDGSIIKGNITEISNDGDVDIELSDGEVFTLKEYNIKKITYEKQVSKKKVSKEDRIAAYKNKLKVDDVKGSRSGYSSFSTSSSIPEVETIDSRSSNRSFDQKKHNLSVGTMLKTYMISGSTGDMYSGFGIAYQYNINKNYSFYSSYNFGKQVDEENFDPSYSLMDQHIKLIQMAFMVSTNNYNGSQLFGGLGVFNEELTASTFDGFNRYSDTYRGLSLHMGFAFSWDTFVLRLRTAFDFSSDYASDVSGTSRNLQLSWNI